MPKSAGLRAVVTSHGLTAVKSMSAGRSTLGGVVVALVELVALVALGSVVAWDWVVGVAVGVSPVQAVRASAAKVMAASRGAKVPITGKVPKGRRSR